MMTPKCLAFFFTLIVFNTVGGEETNTRSSLSSEVAQPMQRRYSEAILASDYSRSVDNMLKKNFVDWLLGRREKKSDNMSDLTKRQMDFQLPELSLGKDTMDESEENRNFVPWLLKNKHMNSVHNDVKVAVCQETLDLLMAMDLCNARFP
ncbi:gastric inhibitory polypeptide [Mixophyes fleayi]|uniref:gastric inhibitory polypeptide n=1 Tax=Mixophyes fleayi TaxID=3061075 RepID=UPI003F4E2CE5